MEEREVEREVILFQLKPYIFIKNVRRVVFLCSLHMENQFPYF